MEAKTTDFIPREYQIELYEDAVKDNVIVYLPTGAGKTYIAVMLLKKLSRDLYKPYKEGGKRSVFAVNTVALVLQQAEYISRHTGLTCAGYSGDMQVDLWKETDWLAEIEKNQVLVMTSQILFDILTRNYLKLNQINLIVFDECHRAVNLHPMRQIMQHFEIYSKQEQPRVLAMSATLLNSNIKPSKIESAIKTLEITFQAKITTVKSMNCVQGYCTNPQENIVNYEPYIIPDIIKKVNQIIEDSYEMLDNIKIINDDIYNESSPVFQPKKKCTKLKAIMKDIQTNIEQLGVYSCNKACLLHLIQLEYFKKHCDDVHTVLILENLITQIVLIRKLLDNEMKNYTELGRIYQFTSDKLLQLFAILKDFNNNKLEDQKFCCIIFVRERFMTQVICHILKNLSQNDEEFNFLLPEFVVGFQNNPYKNTRESLCTAKWNKEVLKKFKNGLSNCIVATDVVDEGIDVPTCTLIIRFDIPLDFRAYVQSKGRARHGSSYYKLLVSTIDEDFPTKYSLFQQTEVELKRILVGYNKLRMLPSTNDVKEDLYKHDIKPYIVMRNNVIQSILPESAAIQLVNMYCFSLLNSKFVHLFPVWTLYERKEEITSYRVSLKLPNISPLKDIILGDFMANIDSAKRSAAMKCCIKLHKMGALTDKLVPADASAVLQKLNYLFPNWIDETKVWQRLYGTYKNVRQHELQHPMALYNAFPHPSVKLYLHVLDLKPVYHPTDNRSLVFHGLLNDKSGFGILSTKSMPKIPSFPIFMNVGEVLVTVKSNYTTMILDEKNIKSLRLYHHLLFSEVVPVMKKFMIFDKDNLENSFLIVPLNAKWEINWDTITNNGAIKRITPSPLAIINSEYELGLIYPSYRGSPSVYVVTKICDDITPQSHFPSDDYDSYQDYYQKKYGLIVKNQNQPILQVKSISTKINCLKPRGIKSTLSKRKKADILEEYDEYLIPEFCGRIDFPALYWLKASTLPSILHRVSQLLIANDLRETISKEAGLGVLTLPPDSEWPSLKITQEMELQANKSFLDISMDETFEIMKSELNINEIKLNSLKTEINVYPWAKDQEPQDLFRNIEKIQGIDIEYYNHFMSIGDSSEDNVALRANKVCYMTKPIVPVPQLNMLQEKSLDPDLVEIMHALTTKMSNDAFNLERLETLGDSFLKFIISLFLYHSFPTFTEGYLTSLKGKIIGNRNLYYCGKKKGLPGRLKLDEFVPMSTFIVPAYTVFRPLRKKLLETNIRSNILYELSIPEAEKIDGYISADTQDKLDKIILEMGLNEKQSDLHFFFGMQMVSDKTVADAVEALIGAYLKNTGVTGATKLLKWLDILPNIQIHELLDNNSPDPKIGEGDPNYHMPWADIIEDRIGYKFKNRAFLLQAFTHPSFIANGITECYQRLEFLGDAILDFLITCHIYEACGNLSPGDLTDLRSALVNNITFACLTVRYGLHTGLLAYAPRLNDAIDNFVRFQEERGYVINDELLQILLEEDEYNIAEYVDVPKALGDIFESLTGAIYLDSGKNLTKVWDIIYSLMHQEIDKFSQNVPKQPIRVIYETYDTRPIFMEAKMIPDTNTIMVPLKLNIGGEEKIFYGFGGNKKQAKCAAAKQALKMLRNDQ